MPLPFVCAVAGVSFHQDEVLMTAVGQVVVVRHQPDNAYDTNACSVTTTGGAELGHLPAALAARLVGTRPDEAQWAGRIEEVLSGQTWGLRIAVGIPDDDAEDASPRPAPPGAAEGAAEPDTGDRIIPDEASPEETAPTQEVRARSGRSLGVWVGEDEGKVVVRNAAGIEIRYPAELVLVG